MKMQTMNLVAMLAVVAAGCGQGLPVITEASNQGGMGGDAGPSAEDRTDLRSPELGDDLSVLWESEISMCEGLDQIQYQNGATIEGKFELGGDGKLALSIYPVGNGIAADAEKNIFREAAGDPTKYPFTTELSTFHDQEHLTRSARDLTLRQLSSRTLPGVACEAEEDGMVYWAIPTIQAGRAGYGVYTLSDCGESEYRFVDGGGSHAEGVADYGTGPGSGATDTRVPKMGDDLSVLEQSQITMAEALTATEAEFGPTIEAKFEVGGDGKLSLSIYPVASLAVDAERSTFAELEGDPTAAVFTTSRKVFTVPDEEHLTRSARDLTLVQTASLSLLDAVKIAEDQVPGGFVYWAIPTRRGTRAGYGIYTREPNGTTHYLFVK